MHWIYFSIAWTLFVLHQANCSGVFELRFKSFQNTAGKDNMGECCSGKTGLNNECTGPCHTRFRVCLKEYQANITNSSCTFGDVMTPILGNNSFSHSRQEARIIRLPFTFKWLGTFTLIVEAWHVSNDSSYFGGNVLISRHTSQRWLGIDDQWTEDVHRSTYTTMEYEFRVTCDPNYYGEGCEIVCRPLDTVFGHYTCSPKGKRVCLSGWIGDYCEKPLCLQGCSKEHGSCDAPNECKCHTGWEGQFCDQCTRHPGCVHGTCVKSWDCLCDEGWGGLFCNQDLNYCTNHKPCHNGGTCYNTGQEGYKCKCLPGFTGAKCESEMDDCNRDTCLNNGSCNNNGTHYVCVCPSGFQGVRCEVSAQQTCNCRNGGSCTDVDGIYKCVCPLGYSGNKCEHRVNNCLPNPCLNGATCVNSANETRCNCASGFTGEMCQINIDDCKADPCLNGGTCFDDVNQFLCRCVPGYVGKRCEEQVDFCLAKPCANGGTCFQLTNDYSCDCTSGFYGKDCSSQIDECQSHPCKAGGICVQQSYGYECQYPKQRVDLCSAKPCANGGTCFQLTSNDYGCNCPPGFSAKDCSSEMNDCQSHPCKPGGICVQQSDGYECQYPVGYLGVEYVEAASSAAPSARVSSDSGLSAEHVVVIATLSTFVPVLVLIAAVVVMCHKQRRKREQAQADEEARLQNEQNTHNSFAKRGSTDAHIIKNSWNKCTNNVHSSNMSSPDECSVSNISVSDNGECYPKPMQVIDGRPVYTLHRTRSHKQLNTEPGPRTSALLSAKLHEPDYESHMRLPTEKRISVLSNSSSVCTASDSSYLKRPPLDKEPVYVIEEHFHRSDVLHPGLFATEV